MGTSPNKDYLKEIEESLALTDIPKIYANGFSLSAGTGDVVIVLKKNNQPTAILNLSFTIAKTLASKLGNTINVVEKITGNSIMTTDQINLASSKDSEKGGQK